MRGITPAVRFLIILNVVVYILEYLFHLPIANLFALPAVWWKTLSFGQLFTYMFVHGSFSHILMNMMGLFFIGPTMERRLGAYRFFILYYISGILGGLGWSLLASPGQYCVGASGAVMGILGAFAALYPHAKVVLIFLPFYPIKAWILVSVLIGFEFFQTFVHPVFGGIANAAHLMGGIAGFCYAYSIKNPNFIGQLKNKLGKGGKSKPKPSSASSAAKLSKEDIDRILDKIGKEGMGALTPREREMLKAATR
ncbi:Rhomboid protease GluP [Pontiella sulfatireligans]|uniref:Rhomboid protease GluP n=2 Tax=Pontiella sulfatireligans TaxID=2750658 RepID=A0A6C2UE40_9BACT|nr:Rhomboid protease GluP [Pontiella sulfatireligans]